MAKEPTQKVLTKKHLARLEKERIQQRYLMIGLGVVLVLIVATVIYGVLDQTVLKNIQPVAKVGSESITTGQFQKEVRFQRYRLIEQLKSMASDSMYLQFFTSYIQQIQSTLNSPTTLGQQVLDSLVEDSVVKQEAQKRNIAISQAEVDQSFNEAFGYFPNGTLTPTVTSTPYSTETLSPTQQALLPATSTPTQEPTATGAANTTPTTAATATATPTAAVTATPSGPTATPTITLTPTQYTKDLFTKNVATYVANVKPINYTQDDLRALLRRSLLRQKVYDDVTKDVSHTAEQVWARHILVATEAEAKQVEDRLSKGEKFADIAASVSTDTGSKSNGGDLGWFAKGAMVKEFEDVAFTLKVGEISQPVKSTYGYHIIQVLGHENRPLTDQQFTSAKDKAYSTWLTDTKKSLNVQTFDTTWQAIIPSDPAIPADLEANINAYLQQQGQGSSQQPIQLPTAPATTAVAPSEQATPTK